MLELDFVSHHCRTVVEIAAEQGNCSTNSVR
jgi:hypothetical protein